MIPDLQIRTIHTSLDRNPGFQGFGVVEYTAWEIYQKDNTMNFAIIILSHEAISAAYNPWALFEDKCLKASAQLERQAEGNYETP